MSFPFPGLSLHGLRDMAECLRDDEARQGERAAMLREIERRVDVGEEEEEEEKEASQARGVSCRCRSRCGSRAAQRGRSAAVRDRATRADMRDATRQATGDGELADGGAADAVADAAPAAATPHPQRAPLGDCTDAELSADFVRFWAAGALSQRHRHATPRARAHASPRSRILLVPSPAL
jgi:hypothetical protein